MNSKNKKRIIIPIILLVLVIALSMSYAWFVWKTEGNQTVKLTGGSLDLRLDETSSNGINILRAIPQSDSQGLENEAYTFSVINNSDVNASYQLYLDDEELDSSEDVRVAYSNIKYSITRNKTAENPILLSETEERKIDDVIINSGDTNSYTLKLWINSEATKEIAEQIFKGKLRLVATQTDEKFKDIAILKDKTSLINHMSTLTSGVANVTALARANELPSTYENDSYKISTDESEYPAYMWYENNTLYYYSEAERLKLPSDCSNLFSGFSNIESADFSGFDTSQVTEMSSMFIGFASNSKIDSINLTGFNTSNVEYMRTMFMGSGIKNIDLRSFDTSNVTAITGMFSGTSSEKINISGLDTGKVTNMTGLFSPSSVEEIDMEGLDFSNVTSTSYMFQHCSAKKINMKGADLRKVTDMSNMFNTSTSLESINLDSVQTRDVTNMSNMFSGCTKLESLDLGSFNTPNLIDMSNFVAGTTALKSIDLSGINTSSVTNMSAVFSGCSSLESVDLSGFNTSNATSMSSMFGGCSVLKELDLSKFNTSKVTSMSYMFAGCTGLQSLDLSSFDTSKVSDMQSMFQASTNLKTIYVSNKWSTSSIYFGSYMFDGCTSLVGGSGSTISSGTDYRYAHVDGGSTNPGLLTLKQ